MEAILALLPVAYVYWASILLVWSVIQAGITGNILRIINNKHQVCRRTDLLIMFTMIVCAAILFATIFIIPHITVLFVDIVMVIALWYTVFLATVSQFNISSMILIKQSD